MYVHAMTFQSRMEEFMIERHLRNTLCGVLAGCALVALAALNAYAQQTTGAPGSPAATTTIDGRYLPPPPPPFQGEINLNALQSKPAWPARVVPPKGAPNILLIMTDDVGFSGNIRYFV
jgi:hypothetical protein